MPKKKSLSQSKGFASRALNASRKGASKKKAAEDKFMKGVRDNLPPGHNVTAGLGAEGHARAWKDYRKKQGRHYRGGTQ